MDFGPVTAKKFSNGYGVSGKSAYDGVFASPIKFRAPSISSSFEDYGEIFGGSEASLGSSIPVLEVPELNERKILHDVQRSKLDYSQVFGGFGNLDTAISYEELFAEPKKKDSVPKGSLGPDKGGKQSSKEDSTNCSKEIPPVSQEASLNGAKKINMSYHKINQGSENRRNGTTHIAQINAVPAYTCLIEEVNPLKINKADKSIPIVQHAYSGGHCQEGIKENEPYMKSVCGPSPDSATKQSSNGGVKVKDRSDSIDMFFNAYEVSHGSDGTNYIEVPTSQTKVGDLDNHHGHAVRSMETKCQVSKSNASEVAAGADSPLLFDDMFDSNSEAAASVAALRKAIEEAQERLKVAKDLMKRKKEGIPDRVRRSFNNDSKIKRKKEDKIGHKTTRHKETNTGETSGEMNALPQMSSVIEKPIMRAEQVTLDFRAEEIFVAKGAAREAHEKPQSTLAELKEEEVEHTEADDKETVLEFKDACNNKEDSYTVDDSQCNEKNASKDASEKPEKSHQTIEVNEGPCAQEANERKVNSGSEVGGCQELVNEKFRCEELVDDTKLAQATLDYGAKYKNLKVEEDKEEIDNNVAPFLKQEDYERKLSEQGLSIGNMKKINLNPEDEKKFEGPCEQEDCHHGLEHKKTQEQIKSEERVEAVSHLKKECEFKEIMEPIDNEKLFNPHNSDSATMERQMEDLSCVVDGKERNEASFGDPNQEIEHCCQGEGIENRVGNMYVQENLEHIVGHDDEKGFNETMTKESDSDGNERVHDAHEEEMELEGSTTYQTEENENHCSESVEEMRVTQNGPNYEENETKEADRTAEISPQNEPHEVENLSKIQVVDTSVEGDKIPEVTPEGYSHNEHNDITVVSDASSQREEYSESESIQEMNDPGEKNKLKTSALAQGALELNEVTNQMQYTSETVSFHSADTNVGEPDEKVQQNQDDCLKEAENYCNLATFVEEPSPEFVDISEYAKEAEDVLNAEIDENQCNSSSEEILVDNECDMEASQPPSMSEWKSNSFDYQEIKRINNYLKENHQATLTIEEKKANDVSQKMELETDHFKKTDEVKEKDREREKEKEKIAVERIIREARERAFAEARERAALERAAAEARRKNISDGRERIGKTTVQTSEKLPTERAAMEAKLKAERAAVERATAEARARALERALSDKAASEARNKSFGASRDNGMKPNFYSKSFSYGDTSDGVNGDSAQRCRAISERHQRIGERVAKALAEKNARDRLVQKEQEERNRMAEALDADVKRWSSGKEGNLRALLSTLQYILGPDSGWQAIHLTDIVNATAVKKAYRKATLFVHPDKLQQRGASIQQKYICEKVFDLLKEAWNRFNMEER